MKNLFLAIAMLLTIGVSAQIPTWFDIDGIDIKRNGSTIFTYPADSSVGYFVMNRDTNGVASSCVVLGDSAQYYRCTFISKDSTWVATNIPVLPAPQAGFAVTYAQASALSAAGGLLEGVWYNITDDSVYLQAITDTLFALNGYYADSVLWEVDAIEFDFPNEHIQQRCDRRGNCVGSTFAISSVMGINPIDVFVWGNDNVLGNTVKDAVLDLSTNADPSVAGNTVLFLSEITVTTEQNIWNNILTRTNATLSDSCGLEDGIFNNATLVVAGGVIFTKANINNGTATLTNLAIATGLNITGEGTVIVSGSANVSNAIVSGSSYLSAMNNAVANNIVLTYNDSAFLSGTSSVINANLSGNNTIIASGDADAPLALLRGGSYLEVSDSVLASGIQLWEGDSVILDGTVNAINCRLYTGADITATGDWFIEGLVAQNVSQLNFTGSGGVMSPAFICNQSILNIADSVNLPNVYFSSAVITMTDSASCVNCWFYSVNSTYNGATLDTSNFSEMNRNVHYLNVDVDTFSLTDGTQGVGKVLTDVTGNGKGTWQDPAAYGEMGFGDSTTTVAITQNVWSIVTNVTKDLWSEGAQDFHDVTYSNDSLIVGSDGTYQVRVENLSMSGTTGSTIEMGVFKNGVLQCTCVSEISLQNNRIFSLPYGDIDGLVAGDVLQVVVMNTQSNDDVIARNGKITVNKVK